MVKSEKKFWAREFLVIISILLITATIFLTTQVRYKFFLMPEKEYKELGANYYDSKLKLILADKRLRDSYNKEYFRNPKEELNFILLYIEKSLLEKNHTDYFLEASKEFKKKSELYILESNRRWNEDNYEYFLIFSLYLMYPVRIGLYLLYHILKGLFKLTKGSIKTLLEKD